MRNSNIALRILCAISGSQKSNMATAKPEIPHNRNSAVWSRCDQVLHGLRLLPTLFLRPTPAPGEREYNVRGLTASLTSPSLLRRRPHLLRDSVALLRVGRRTAASWLRLPCKVDPVAANSVAFLRFFCVHETVMTQFDASSAARYELIS